VISRGKFSYYAAKIANKGIVVDVFKVFLSLFQGRFNSTPIVLCKPPGEATIVASSAVGIGLRESVMSHSINSVCDLAHIGEHKQEVCDALISAGFSDKAQELLDFFEICPDMAVLSGNHNVIVPVSPRDVWDGSSRIEVIERMEFSKGYSVAAVYAGYRTDRASENGDYVWDSIAVSLGERDLDGFLAWKAYEADWPMIVADAEARCDVILESIDSFMPAAEKRFGKYILGMRL
jgi:hypothetical protein